MTHHCFLPGHGLLHLQFSCLMCPGAIELISAQKAKVFIKYDNFFFKLLRSGSKNSNINRSYSKLWRFQRTKKLKYLPVNSLTNSNFRDVFSGYFKKLRSLTLSVVTLQNKEWRVKATVHFPSTLYLYNTCLPPAPELKYVIKELSMHLNKGLYTSPS